jgi:formate hydrogenlyase transcriptional activator
MHDNSLLLVRDKNSRRSSDQLRLLIQVSEAIATHRHLTTLFRDLAKRLPAIVPFEYIALYLHDPEKKVMRVDMLGTADADSIPPGLEVPVDGSFSGIAFTTQQPVIVRNREQASRFPLTLSLMQKTGTESFCILPLTTIVRRLGAMGFGSSSAHAFDESELEFLQLVVKQVAVAVDNVLHDESAAAVQAQLSHERDRLRLLLEVSESVASHQNLSELVHDLAQRLPRVVPFDYINLTLHDPVRNVMRLHLLVAPTESTVYPGFELPLESPSGVAWQTQQPVMVEDVETEPRFQHLAKLLRENQVRSWCAVPLTTALRRLGAMGFGGQTRTVYQEEDLNFLQQVANQVAVAVDNVLHHESAQSAQQLLTRERDRLQLLLEVNNAVVSHLDLDDVFDAVSACLRRVIPHEGSSLLLFEAGTGTFRLHVLRLDTSQSWTQEGQTAEQGCDRSPAGIAVATKRPMLFGEEDLRGLAMQSKCAEALLTEAFKSYCCVPLLSHDRILGTINVGSSRANAFSPGDVELLGQVAQQVAIAVENGLAYRQIADLKEKLNSEKLYLEDEIRTERNFGEIIGESAGLKQVLHQVEIVAPTDSTVLIQGETGTGKELIARAIHGFSGRRGRTFVKLNCAAIPTGLLESELFGHEKGAFTGAITQKTGRFELAHGGTLFLDEVGDIPLELQSKFLRVLQEQEFERLGGTRTIRVDIRLVAATNCDLAAMVDEKRFRSDLYYRLRVFPILSPPLRERREDIAPLVRYFTQKFARRMNKRIETISSATMATLCQYHWPGNIRELENFIERAVILSRGSRLDVPLAELTQAPKAPVVDAVRSPTTLEHAEREHIRRALHESNWRIGGASGAAARLGMKRTTLQSKMARLGIARPAVQ